MSKLNSFKYKGMIFHNVKDNLFQTEKFGDYWVEWISAGGYIAVKNDDGKIKPYAASNFYKGDL
jgi:hypothetical protein